MENYKDLKILVVDDLQENLISLKTVLEKNNFIVETAESGKKALDLLLKQDFGLALLDVQMPQMDGFEVAEHMKSNNRTKNIPIVFLSALATQRDFFKKGFEVGAIDYLTKPLDADLLLLKVSNLLMLS
ncbi:MAG: PleD family two-component system response regulator, partial [Bacteroidia bacterium]